MIEIEGEYEGDFFDDEQHGHGVFRSAKGDYTSTGKYENGQMNGNGKTEWTDGSHYEGNYKDSKKHGTGRYTYDDGRYYDGKWKEGHKHGEGDYKTSKGDVLKALFNMDQRIEYVDNDGDRQ